MQNNERRKANQSWMAVYTAAMWNQLTFRQQKREMRKENSQGRCSI